jgi:UDP-N-acetylmuramate--alanine ligase
MSPQNQSELRQFKNVYFLGIGGIGMSALARWFHKNSFIVLGYDKTPGSITAGLEKEGIAIHFEDSLSAIPSFIKDEKEKTLVVLTPAIPKDHTEWQYFRESGYEIMKRSQVLGLISQGCFTVGVAGTHGKTTTSSMVAYLLKEAGLPCTAFLGGISANYGTNFIPGDKPLTETIMVVEADEFDRSFLTLHPDIAVVTSVDADHLDIYGNSETLKKAYADFVAQIKREGSLFIHEKVRLLYETRTGVRVKTYGTSEGDIRAEQVQASGFGFEFELKEDLISHGRFRLNMPGFHNLDNAVAALAVAHKLGVSFETLRQILPGFKGVKRRFEKVYEDETVVLLDDYAHHPSEIDATIRSLRVLYPDKKLGLVFQPHLFSRTRDFALEFSHALNQADKLWLLDIYPARELPVSGVSSRMILDRVDLSEKEIVSADKLINSVLASDCQVVAMLGAGDIDRLVAPMKEAFVSRLKSFAS